MNIEKTSQNGVVTLTLAGRLDAVTAPELDKILDESFPEAQDLIFDMAGVEYISSAGLRVILKAQKVMSINGSMKLIHVGDAVMEVFDFTGFLDILTIE